MDIMCYTDVISLASSNYEHKFKLCFGPSGIVVNCNCNEIEIDRDCILNLCDFMERQNNLYYVRKFPLSECVGA